MSEITTRFKSVYQERNLDNLDYYLYGSGGGAQEILCFIKEQKLRAPIAVLDNEAKNKPVDTLSAYDLVSVEHPVVVSSISFYSDIKRALTAHNPAFKSKLIPLMPYSENVTNRLYISELAWQEYQSHAESAYRNKHNWSTSQLSDHGYYIGQYSESRANEFLELCQRLDVIPRDIESSKQDFDYFSNYLTGEDNLDLARLEVTDQAKHCVSQFVQTHYDEIAIQMGSNWRIVNTRITQLAKVKNSQRGSNKLHLDAMPEAVKKILLYLTPPSNDHGSTFLQLQDGTELTVTGASGTWLLFQNSRLLHRGLSTDKLNRIVCEITIAPCQYKNTDILVKGHASQYPYKPWKRCGANKVNLGGGANFNGENWICYDEREGANIEHITFSPNTILPNRNESCSLVYSSHFFEHIDNLTLDNLLGESWRILLNDGDLLIKLPDFDTAREAGLKGDLDYFEQFPLTSEMLSNWQQNNVDPKCALTLAANVITSYWNADFGHLYQHQSTPRQGYYGPAKLSSDEFKTILSRDSIQEISKILTQKIIATETDFQFNHQNAWSMNEFIQLVSSFGFELVSTDYELIKYAFPDVPDLEAHLSMSNYFYFKKISHKEN
ncbi:hypothetical protein [Pseudoalteromonas sp. T1lg23B]|uniref:hypothetical protein n=1 Tax=Pseudoalteromonas sp. T1lg23B TaxID=2077097 RepID=UPI000CF69E59|nr:hypothetical protein [Pseudoalteromonas sp. T1lg23B]